MQGPGYGYPPVTMQPMPGQYGGPQQMGGMQPGMAWGQGMQPGMQPGMHPGMQPGMQSGMQPGGPMPQVGRRGPVPLPFMAQPPQIPPDCPPGLELLSLIDHVFIRQCLEPVEIATGIETENAYQVMSGGFMMFWAQEHSDFCLRQMCGGNRPFEMSLTNQFGINVMRLVRPYRCDMCCCCDQTLYVEAPAGRRIGSVVQACSFCEPTYMVKNALGQVMLKIEGPCCICGMVEFAVKDRTGRHVGKVTKHWSGIPVEALTDADFFGVSFPANLPVDVKALILGSCFLIDFMYFEKSANDNHHNRH